jgi:hypothetical protein
MKRSLPLLAASITVLCGTAIIVAQQQPQKINYRSTVYVKVAPEKDAAMMDFIRNASKKLMQERINSGEPITSWVVLRLAYQGTPALDYNYAVTTTYAGAPSQVNEATRDEIYRKATGMSFQDYIAKLPTLGTNVGSILYRVEAATPSSPMQEGNYITVTRWKVTPLRGGDYASYVRDMLLPLNAQAVKDGRSMGWSAARVVSPGGDEAPFDAVISNTVRDLATALPATAPSPNAGQVNFAKVFPGQNYATFVDQGRALRGLVRTELFRVVTAAEGPATTSSLSGGR